MRRKVISFGTRSHSGKGFTLIELLVVVTIAAIFAALAAPAFGSFIAGQRVKTASYDVWSILTLARSEALKRNSSRGRPHCSGPPRDRMAGHNAIADGPHE